MKLEPTGIGKAQRTFEQQMRLEQLDDLTFRSVYGSSGEIEVKHKGCPRKRAFGGHVYAQAVWAAAQTVGEAFLIHSVSGNFVSAGWCDVPFIYKVENIREGRSYVIRRVDVTQLDTDGLCFTCTCSFKKPETSPFEVQDEVPPHEKYKAFLKGWRPQDGPDIEIKSLENLLTNTRRGYTTSLPSVKAGLLPMEEYNKKRAPLDRRHLLYYSINGALPSVKTAPNLHACNHLYLCDQLALRVIASHFDLLGSMTAASSLSTTVVFHSHAEHLAMHTDAGEERWFCQEVWTDRFSDGRGSHHSRIWDDKGRHVITTVQDAQIRAQSKI